MSFLIYLEFDHAITEDEINAIQMVCKKITLVLYNLNLKASLKFQAIHDSLTGLYNRRYIDEFLEQQINQAERYDKQFAVLLIDIDFFILKGSELILFKLITCPSTFNFLQISLTKLLT